ncbi:ABC transporter substrate-binding protein [Streptomyces sp. NPDC001508]|uniref:ABC transporter substrate-binding protein n=1 Tax=Streptomyces sp. NPDC001508 TaxID=3154656 RepID=UPI0033181214
MPATVSRRTALAAGMGLLATACSAHVSTTGAAGRSPDPAHPIDVELAFMNFPAYTTALPKTLGADFTRRTGVTVKLNNVGQGSYEAVDQRIQAGLAAGNPPDLALIGLNSVRTYADAHLAMPLDSYVSAGGAFTPGDFYPSFLELGKQDGKTWALPYGVSVLLLYYNADIFRKAGLDPDHPPATLSQLRTAAQRIVSSGAARYGVNLSADGSGLWGYQNLILSGGGALMNADETHVTLTDTKVSPIIQYWADITKSGLGRPLDRKTEQDAFLRGDLGMFFQANSAIVSLTSAKHGFPVRTAPFPIPDGGTRKAPAAGGGLMVLSKDPDKQAAAWAVITELTSPRGATALTKASGYLTPNRVAAKSESYLAPFYRETAGMTVALSEVPAVVPWYQFPGIHATEIMTLISDDFLAARRGSMTVSKALADATNRSEELLP